MTERTVDDARQLPARDGAMGSALRGRLAAVLLHHVGGHDRFNFELQLPFKKLQAAVVRNRFEHIVHLHHAAASGAAGYVELVYEANSLNMGTAHFSTDSDHAAHLRHETIQCVRIDDILQGAPIDFVKIDIEGAEYLAIEGADQMFREHRPLLMIEFNEPQLAAVSKVSPAMLMERLLAYGYVAHRIVGRGQLQRLTDPVAEMKPMLVENGIANFVFASSA